MPMITVSEDALNHIEQMAKRIVAIKEEDEAAFQEILARALTAKSYVEGDDDMVHIWGLLVGIIKLAESRLADTSRIG